MTEGATLPGVGGVGHAAVGTGMALLDVIFGVLLPIFLVLLGAGMANTAVGGYVAVGNGLWGTFGGAAGGGTASQTQTPIITLSGPQTGALTGMIFALAWGGVTLAAWHFGGKAGNRWVRYLARSLAGFFLGMALFSVYFVIYSLSGGSAATLLGAGGPLDKLLAGVQNITLKTAGG